MTMRENMTDIRRRSREEIMVSLSSGSPDEIRDALINACYWHRDWKWLLQQLRKFAEHGDDRVLWAVATGVGFIAAFYGEIDEHEAQSILTRLKANGNSAVAAAAEEAEANIEHFVEHRQRGEAVELVERRPEDRLFLPAESYIATDPTPRQIRWLQQLAADSKRQSSALPAIAGSRTPPWLASGWGFRDRRLSGG
jgi:hypothetical protein